MAEGDEPLRVLENLGPELELDEATLKLLRRDPIETRLLELSSQPENGKQYEGLYQKKIEIPKIVVDWNFCTSKIDLIFNTTDLVRFQAFPSQFPPKCFFHNPFVRTPSPLPY